MPYTPPSAQSPASSRNSTPAISRTASFSEDGLRSPASSRPQPPRSNSSSYLHKHRRSPSLSVTEAAGPPTPAEAPGADTKTVDFAHNSSVRQSPPPVNNLRIPTGMVLSPPESPENSDGDDTTKERRGREIEKTWDQLKEAVRGIDQRRSGSPDRLGVQIQAPKSPQVSEIATPQALTAEARRIAHSRSSTENAIIIPKTPTFESPMTASPTQTSDDSDEDQGPFSKPSLVRKKSGELVKPALRASSRRRYSSMPGTPTYSKSVHFNEEVNQTRHFLSVDKPMAVSAGTSPVESYESESEFPFDSPSKTEREIKLANFPEDTFERRAKPVRVERLFLSADKQTLIGSLAVQNISFHKLVVARFTLDAWKTTSEVVADYNNDPRTPPKDGCDRFSFSIQLSDSANIDTKTLLLCVRYAVNGTDYWDNNNGLNYQVDFGAAKPAPKAAKPTISISGLGARPLNAIPRSRHSPTKSRGRQESVDDDFARMDSNSAYHFGSSATSADKLLGDSPSSSIKLKPRGNKRGSIFPTAAASNPAAAGSPSSANNGLGGRYDFGASLSAALTSAQDKLGRQSGLMSQPGRRPGTGGSYFGPLDRTATAAPTKADERPDAVTMDRPAMGSDQYRDLVQKFCYFTPAGKSGGSPVSVPPISGKAAATGPRTDGTAVDSGPEGSSPAPSSRGGGESSPLRQLDGDGGGSARASPDLSPFMSRSGSPVPTTGYVLGDRTGSPVGCGYPNPYLGGTRRDGYLADLGSVTAIKG
ncbi:hypothetical protein LTR53_008061 [Teratosphaeriaceae sp. CCFEE 6253]|nr:hypothetical protein LTR53_008061 [Teratosphaeriaceae sp. CCFEE 6253]